MSLTSLSNELLSLIIENIPAQSTLFSLFLCSKHLSGLVRPRLYASVTFNYPHQSFERLYGLAHAVLRSPENALYVRHFAIRCWITHDELNYRPEGRLSPSAGLDFDYLETVVRRYSHSETDTANWMDDLRKGVEDALLVLVLPALVRLEHVELSTPHGAGYYERMLVQVRNGPRGSDSFLCFNSLTTLTVSWWATENGLQFSQLRPFFTIPSMRSLRGTSIIEAEKSNHDDDPVSALLLPHSSGITDISLGTSNLGPEDFEEIFQACKCIKSFRYQHADGGIGYHEFSTASIARALPAAKHDLEELCVENADIHFCLDGFPEENILIGSLTGFIALRSVRTQPSVLLGPERPATVHLNEVLPHSLESLHFIGCVDDEEVMVVLGELEILLAEKTSRFPRLSKIICERPFTIPIRLGPPKDDRTAYWPPPEFTDGVTRAIIPYNFQYLLRLASSANVLIEVEDTKLQEYWRRTELKSYVQSVTARLSAILEA